MANTSISNLSAGAAVSATDVMPNVQTAGVGPVKSTAAELKTFMSASPTLVTPNIGVASGTSLSTTGALTTGTQQTAQGSVVLANTAAGAFSTTIQSSNSATAAWTLTLPTAVPAANGAVLTSTTGGVSSWTSTLPVANGGTGLTSGTSGGVLYYSAAGTLASSGALTANALVIGGGAGVAPSTTTTGANVLTFLGTPSSANLASALTDKTGTGVNVFDTSPQFTTGIGVGTAPAYLIDARGNSSSAIHLAGSSTDSGAYINSPGSAEVSFAGGAAYNSYSAPNYVFTAKTTVAGGMYVNGNAIDLWFNTGLTAGNTFNKTNRVGLDSSGNWRPATDNAVSCGTAALRWSVIYAATGTINTSDVNTKTDIVASPLGLDFITKLNPVAYKFKVGGRVVGPDYDEDGTEVVHDTPGERQHFGLIAQDVKAALPKDVDFGGWVLMDKDDPKSEQGLRYEEFISPLIKAIQELKAEIDALKAAK